MSAAPLRITPFGRRILLLVPHPDDEIVACCTTIAQAQATGATVFAAYLTHGCVASAQLWPWQRRSYAKTVLRRWREARRVAAVLRVQPVLWSKRPARHLWRDLPQVTEEIMGLIAAHGIDQLWVPAYEGGNADHDGLNGLVAALPPVHQQQVSVLEFAEYNWHGGHSNSHTLPFPSADTVVYSLTPAERACKEFCLSLYESERRNLSYVQTRRESFRSLAAYDYQQPPHPGLLWYERFQWVPFAHPGVDRTRPAEVCAAIMAYRQWQGL
jgi:N-acetylglucosamine malate deacetylase 1